MINSTHERLGWNQKGKARRYSCISKKEYLLGPMLVRLRKEMHKALGQCSFWTHAQLRMLVEGTLFSSRCRWTREDVAGVLGMEHHGSALPQSKTARVQMVWSAWNFSLPSMEEVRQFHRGYGPEAIA